MQSCLTRPFYAGRKARVQESGDMGERREEKSVDRETWIVKREEDRNRSRNRLFCVS